MDLIHTHSVIFSSSRQALMNLLNTPCSAPDSRRKQLEEHLAAKTEISEEYWTENYQVDTQNSK